MMFSFVQNESGNGTPKAIGQGIDNWGVADNTR